MNGAREIRLLANVMGAESLMRAVGKLTRGAAQQQDPAERQHYLNRAAMCRLAVEELARRTKEKKQAHAQVLKFRREWFGSQSNPEAPEKE